MRKVIMILFTLLMYVAGMSQTTEPGLDPSLVSPPPSGYYKIFMTNTGRHVAKHSDGSLYYFMESSSSSDTLGGAWLTDPKYEPLIGGQPYRYGFGTDSTVLDSITLFGNRIPFVGSYTDYGGGLNLQGYADMRVLGEKNNTNLTGFFNAAGDFVGLSSDTLGFALTGTDYGEIFTEGVVDFESRRINFVADTCVSTAEDVYAINCSGVLSTTSKESLFQSRLSSDNKQWGLSIWSDTTNAGSPKRSIDVFQYNHDIETDERWVYVQDAGVNMGVKYDQLDANNYKDNSIWIDSSGNSIEMRVDYGTGTVSGSDIITKITSNGLIAPNTAIDPPGQSGAIVYNTDSAGFRFYEDGTWTSLGSNWNNTGSGLTPKINLDVGNVFNIGLDQFIATMDTIQLTGGTYLNIASSSRVRVSSDSINMNAIQIKAEVNDSIMLYSDIIKIDPDRLPTDSTGLPKGALWGDDGVLRYKRN